MCKKKIHSRRNSLDTEVQQAHATLSSISQIDRMASDRDLHVSYSGGTDRSQVNGLTFLNCFGSILYCFSNSI